MAGTGWNSKAFSYVEKKGKKPAKRRGERFGLGAALVVGVMQVTAAALGSEKLLYVAESLKAGDRELKVTGTGWNEGHKYVEVKMAGAGWNKTSNFVHENRI